MKKKYCDCDDYEWLSARLKSMATFLWVHGQGLEENRGPFKFCPYCGKAIKIEEKNGNRKVS